MKNQRLFTSAVALSYALHACGSSKSDVNSPGAGASSDTTEGGSGSTAGGGAGTGDEATSNAGENTGGTGDASGSSNASGSSSGGASMAGAAGEGGGNSPSPDTCAFPVASALDDASVPAGYCAYVWARNLIHPRGIVVDENGDVLVSDKGRIVLLHDDNGNGVSDDAERVVLRTQAGLNHGIAINGGFLYASTPTTVYRWPYAGNRKALGNPQQVVTGIPTGGHVTRTLQFDTQGRLYVSIGSGSNLDTDSRRARLLRYAANALGATSTFADGELFADGLRKRGGAYARWPGPNLGCGEWPRQPTAPGSWHRHPPRQSR